MKRLEEHRIIIDELAKRVEERPSGTAAQMVTFQLGDICTALIDISKSLAIIADKADGDICLDGIISLPPVTPKPRWIPVSERLPVESALPEDVLFCDIDGDIMIGYHINGKPNTHFTQQGTYEDIKNVVAWMPLPQPYRG